MVGVDGIVRGSGPAGGEKAAHAARTHGWRKAQPSLCFLCFLIFFIVFCFAPSAPPPPPKKKAARRRHRQRRQRLLAHARINFAARRALAIAVARAEAGAAASEFHRPDAVGVLPLSVGDCASHSEDSKQGDGVGLRIGEQGASRTARSHRARSPLSGQDGCHCSIKKKGGGGTCESAEVLEVQKMLGSKKKKKTRKVQKTEKAGKAVPGRIEGFSIRGLSRQAANRVHVI